MPQILHIDLHCLGESKDGVKESEYSMGQYKETTRFIPSKRVATNMLAHHPLHLL